jgi:hypothetical protein
MSYSSGKHAYGICDKTGFRYPLSKLVFEYRNGSKTGLRVGVDVIDPDHPQNFVGRIKFDDPQSVQDARVDRVEPDTEVILPNNPFTTAAASSGSTVITVNQKSHGHSSSDRLRFRNCVGFDGITASVLQLAAGYVITKVNDDSYTFTVSASSTTGSVTGGGPFATSGPVTLEA